MRNAKRTKSSFTAWMFFMSPDEKVRKAKPAAVPNRTFMVGPAKQAATAIFGRPSRATVRLAIKSPTELPHARTVAPSKASEMPQILPAAVSKETTSPATTSIHTMETRKATMVSMPEKRREAGLLVVVG